MRQWTSYFYSENGVLKFVAYYAILLTALICVCVFDKGSANGLTDGLLVRTTVLAGLVLGIDVALASVSVAHRTRDWKSRYLWCFRVAASHSF